MVEKDIIKNWSAGGTLREKAIAVTFNDASIKTGIERATFAYKIVMQQLFPDIRSAMNNQNIKTYVDYLFIEAVCVVDKKIRINEFKGTEYVQLKSFLVTTAKNKCIELLRKKKHNVGLEKIEEPVHEENILEKEDRHGKLRVILEEIGKNCKEVLLKYYAGFSMKEIATALDLKNADVAKQIKARCFKRLKALIGNDIELRPY